MAIIEILRRRRYELLLYILALQSALANRRTQVEHRKRLLVEYMEFEMHVTETLTRIYEQLDQETCEAGDPNCEAELAELPEQSVKTVDAFTARIENIHDFLNILLPAVMNLNVQNSPAVVPHPLVSPELNSTTAFSCGSDGEPLSLCFWDHRALHGRKAVLIDGNFIQYNGSDDAVDGGVSFQGEGRILKGGRCLLQIHAVHVKDIGRWSCTLVSQAGQIFTGEVIVGFTAPKRSGNAPQETVHAELDKSLGFSCQSPPGQELSLCLWERTSAASNGLRREMILVDQQVRNGSQTSVDGITYNGGDGLKGRKCGLKIHKVSQADLNTVWTCSLVSQNGTISTGNIAVVEQTWRNKLLQSYLKIRNNVEKTWESIATVYTARTIW